MAIGVPVCIGKQTSADVTPKVLTTTDAVPAGALIIFTSCGWDSNGALTESVAGGGLTWDEHGQTIRATNYFFEVWSASAPSGLASATDITLTSDASGGSMITCVYVEGADTSSGRVDGSVVHNADTSSSSAWTTGSGSISEAGSILIATTMGDGVTTLNSVSTTAPAAEISSTEQVDAGHEWVTTMSYRLPGAAGSYTISGTFSDAANFGDQAAWIAFKEAAAPWVPEEDSPRTLRTIAAPRF